MQDNKISGVFALIGQSSFEKGNKKIGGSYASWNMLKNKSNYATNLCDTFSESSKTVSTSSRFSLKNLLKAFNASSDSCDT